MLENFGIDYKKVLDKLYGDRNVKPVRGNEDKMIRVAFDFFRLKDSDPETLWQVQKADDGQEYLMRTFSDDAEEKLKSESDWDVQLNKEATDISIYKSNVPIHRMDLNKMRIGREESEGFRAFIYGKLCRKDSEFLQQLAIEIPLNKISALKEAGIIDLDDVRTKAEWVILKQARRPGSTVPTKKRKNETDEEHKKREDEESEKQRKKVEKTRGTKPGVKKITFKEKEAEWKEAFQNLELKKQGEYFTTQPDKLLIKNKWFTNYKDKLYVYKKDSNNYMSVRYYPGYMEVEPKQHVENGKRMPITDNWKIDKIIRDEGDLKPGKDRSIVKRDTSVDYIRKLWYSLWPAKILIKAPWADREEQESDGGDSGHRIAWFKLDKPTPDKMGQYSFREDDQYYEIKTDTSLKKAIPLQMYSKSKRQKLKPGETWPITQKSKQKGSFKQPKRTTYDTKYNSYRDALTGDGRMNYEVDKALHWMDDDDQEWKQAFQKLELKKKIAGLPTTGKSGGHKSPPKGYPKDKSQYADPNNYKYPLDTEKHVRAAHSYLSQKKNQKGYSTAEVATMMSRIKSAGKKYGIEYSKDEDGQYKEAFRRLELKKVCGADWWRKLENEREESLKELATQLEKKYSTIDEFVNHLVSIVGEDKLRKMDWHTGTRQLYDVFSTAVKLNTGELSNSRSDEKYVTLTFDIDPSKSLETLMRVQNKMNDAVDKILKVPYPWHDPHWDE